MAFVNSLGSVFVRTNRNCHCHPWKTADRMRLKWMVEDDETILEFLDHHDIPTTAQIIAFELDISHGQIKQRLRKLKDHNMVEQPEEVPKGLTARGVYQLTDLGRNFIRGDITIKELRELDPSTGESDSES